MHSYICLARPTCRLKACASSPLLQHLRIFKLVAEKVCVSVMMSMIAGGLIRHSYCWNSQNLENFWQWLYLWIFGCLGDDIMEFCNWQCTCMCTYQIFILLFMVLPRRVSVWAWFGRSLWSYQPISPSPSLACTPDFPSFPPLSLNLSSLPHFTLYPLPHSFI